MLNSFKYWKTDFNMAIIQKAFCVMSCNFEISYLKIIKIDFCQKFYILYFVFSFENYFGNKYKL